MKWIADGYQQIPLNMKCKRAAEKKRLQRMINNYAKDQAGKFIAGVILSILSIDVSEKNRI